MVTTTPTVVVCWESVMCPYCPTWRRPSVCRRAFSSSLGTWSPCCSRRRCWRRSWCRRPSPWTRSPWGRCSGIGVLCSTPARRAAPTCIMHTREMQLQRADLLFFRSQACPCCPLYTIFLSCVLVPLCSRLCCSCCCLWLMLFLFFSLDFFFFIFVVFVVVVDIVVFVKYKKKCAQ